VNTQGLLKNESTPDAGSTRRGLPGRLDRDAKQRSVEMVLSALMPGVPFSCSFCFCWAA
jgi:hypothetical protein